MDALINTHMPLFATGVLVGATLLVAGIMFGLWVGRRTGIPLTAKSLNDYHLLTLLGGVSKLTSGFADDVSQHRRVVDQVSEQLNSVGADEVAADHASVMSMMQQISDANEQLQGRIDKAETALKDQAGEIAGYMAEARTDKLTNLPNRRVLDDELPRRVAEWNRYQTTIALMIVDIDFFKKFNDEHGHLAGDAVLQQVAQLIRETVRESDLPVRMGGEEFAVVLPGIADKQVWLAAERLRRAIEECQCRYENTLLSVTISIGAAQAVGDDDTPTELIKRADEALYSAKRAGRNRSHWHDGRTITPITTGNMPPQQAAPEQNDVEFNRVCLQLRERLLAVVNDESL